MTTASLLDLIARKALLISDPNPRVGCLIFDNQFNEIGRGFTQQRGAEHAEIVALKSAQSKGHCLIDSIVFVSLEPCSHHGRTGPCCNALIAAGVKKVVVSIADPNPLVAGQGFARLRAAGVQVEIGEGASEARELNIGFFSRMIRKTPWVRMKTAASLDGTTALHNGQSQWITGDAARLDGHAWRARASAVLTGIGTVLTDNPLLDVRHVATPRQPHLVVVDSRLETPRDARLFGPKRQVLIYAAIDDPAKKAPLEAAGAIVICMPGAMGKVDLLAMMQDLAQREVNELHVEAGSKLNASLIEAGVVDEYLVYFAPSLLGPGQGLAALPQLTELTSGCALNFVSAQMVGNDLRVIARGIGRDAF